MAKPPARSTVAERALKRAIEEETAQLQVDLRAAREEIAGLKSVLARIAGIAGDASAVAQSVIAHLAQTASAPPVDKLPPELQAHLKAPPPEEPMPQAPGPDLAGEDNLGEGRWV